jgi:23S rRNA pseudouridine1911/1915/1917 synthase
VTKNKIKILYKDKDILAIDKPAGVLVDEVLTKFPGTILAHRLDKETSGVMLLAKSEKAHEFLKKQFSAPALGLKTKRGLVDRPARINKTYLALVEGEIKNDHGIINKPIGRSPSDFRRRLAGRGARGELREAITEYKVLKEITFAKACQNFYPRGSHFVPLNAPKEGRRGKNSGMPKQNFTLLEVSPKTGRTHQIRVHMKFINHPIVGDKLYNPKPLPNLPLSKGEEQGGGRMMLHAKSIELVNLAGRPIKVESPTPLVFRKICPVLSRGFSSKLSARSVLKFNSDTKHNDRVIL